MAAPDRARMQAAVREFLAAAGLDLADPNLLDTPARVAEAWALEFLGGYGRSPVDALGEAYPVPGGRSGELVVVSHLEFRSACPHHLLPYAGVAHLAYVPSDRVVGFGRLKALLDALAHRLVLQEDLARSVAEALAAGLNAPFTACALRAEQACLRLRGEEQHRAMTYAESYAGHLRDDAALRARFARVVGP
jgi:GTP cyclohydrolase I